MRRPHQRTIRSAAVAVVVVCLLFLGNSALAASTTTPPASSGADTAGNGSGSDGIHLNIEATVNQQTVTEHAIPDGAELTVIATQGFFVSDETADLIAITRSGRVVYHNSTYRTYFDVDHVEGTRYTVEYVGAEHIEACETFEPYWCTRNVVERVNLSTGETELIYAERTPRVHGTRWHDADRINDSHIAIADIYNNSVTIVNTVTDEVVWEWHASRIYDASAGGDPDDWTHINDVEVLADGTLMLSMRNMNEVVFVKPGEGYQANRTLGSEDRRAILFEQHNPDYIPESHGGPAILVGDSENNRIMEYQRVNGTWKQSWLWRDARLQWPRDADRLPNNRTLVADSHGDRVIEISPNGSIAWSVGVGMPYDVERIGSGPESAGGLSMQAIKGGGGGIANANVIDHALIVLKDSLPSSFVNGLIFVGPAWMQFVDWVVAAFLLGVLAGWGLLEYRWANWTVRSGLRSLFSRVREFS